MPGRDSFVEWGEWFPMESWTAPAPLSVVESGRFRRALSAPGALCYSLMAQRQQVLRAVMVKRAGMPAQFSQPGARGIQMLQSAAGVMVVAGAGVVSMCRESDVRRSQG